MTTRPSLQISFPDLIEEHDAASTVKRDTPVLVVLGNPPYDAFAGVSPTEEGGLIDVYKEGLKDWGITKNSLDDLYVRFLRIAERQIADRLGKGIVCLISNMSYTDDPSHVILRRRLLAEFDAITIDCLNGDSRRTGKLTPDGEPDPSVFSRLPTPKASRSAQRSARSSVDQHALSLPSSGSVTSGVPRNGRI